MFIGFLRRNWAISHPPQPAKEDQVLKIGLLGASKIAPTAVIEPALNHPSVVIAAVAARDPAKGQEYAKKHNIPVVYNSYQELIDEPTIDAIYIALPNGLHYEWAAKSLQAGKHVLLEKPSVSNSIEATALFRHPSLTRSNAPVIIEAVHSRFHPAFQTFISLLDPPNIVSAHSSAKAPGGYVALDDIRFNYDLAGGSCMDPGSYAIMTLRQMLGAEPEECLEANARMLPQGYDQNCDQAITAKFRFPNGALGKIDVDLNEVGGYWLPWITMHWPAISIPACSATHREVTVPDDKLAVEEEHVIVKTVTLLNYLLPHHWHRIDISEKHMVRNIRTKETLRTWTVTASKKAYKWDDPKKKGEAYWSSYRYQLEEFVNKIKGRDGSGVWIDGEDSINQMRMIDSVYQKAGLLHRPSSKYLEL
ncbi:D-xylose 1-dehydrogenase (NADP(+)) 2 [Hyphodiscus hymeniophilus]|uniref:D-xylose 1-dehydrogenase (NADP(+), D-xylono-1,5-lactone-forming) n=1 Tax=Hyphodiscus hymeniophilus TaxID=353542 RepID=A0A9P7B0S9_9HELO|nr:D-xylose 1-dehydrogenase (NADP(+)) 2 [Hyphodiscus hymeniophilus]